MNIVNLAHGAFVLIGAYIAWKLNASAGIDPFLGMVVAAVALFVAGYLIQRYVINLVVNAPIWMTLLLTFGLACCSSTASCCCSPATSARSPPATARRASRSVTSACPTGG